MPFVSYSQNREDVVLQRVFAKQPSGFYIDVGANDPVLASMTKGFYERGWHGINIEPVPSVFERLQTDRPRDTNLNVGIGNCSKTTPFFEFPESTISTFSEAEAEYRARTLGLVYERRQVAVTTLADVCSQHVQGEIDFLSIDAENFERQVIEGNDWTRWRPKVLVVEDSMFSEAGLQSHTVWEPLLLAANYLFALFDGINRFYVRQENANLMALLQAPANCQDDYVTYETVCLRGELDRARALARQVRIGLARHPLLLAASRPFARFVFPGLWKSAVELVAIPDA
jgi:FkbM family methyltransferase